MTVIERFLEYVKVDTMSDENNLNVPSSPNQLVLGKILKEEMEKIGLSQVRQEANGYVYGILPASVGMEDVTPIGFISHMDTAPAMSGANIKPRVIHYEGGDIKLNEVEAIRTEDFETLETYKGQDLIVTDGTTLLGADDKAGVAEILTAMEYLIAHPEVKHGQISVGFTPDEEIGRGADCFDIENFGAKYAYTVDGGPVGELEYENFNGAAVNVKIKGVNIHPGSAKNKMKNAVLVANHFISMLPVFETPAHTENYEGFYHVDSISGNETQAEIGMIIRDHSKIKFEEKKDFVLKVTEFLNGIYGEGTIETIVKDSYYNMKEKIEPVIHIVDKAKSAFIKADVEPKVIPIRGGTDGAALSYNGLPCPNISTGGENFHGIHEFISIQSMEKMVEVIINIATGVSDK